MSTPIILDCDTGTDDAVAILLHLDAGFSTGRSAGWAIAMVSAALVMLRDSSTPRKYRSCLMSIWSRAL